MKKQTTICLVEAAAMIALATVLSMIAVIKMPFGGSVTACSMMPIILYAYRRDIKWGVFGAFVYSVLQLLLGMSNLQYATSAVAACAIVFLDYIIAFTVLGLAPVFKKRFSNQTSEIIFGTVVVCTLRYLCHVITGCTVWAGVSIPSSDGIIYSLTYNAAYMVPELIITVAALWYISRTLDFSGEKITANKKEQDSMPATVAKSVGILSLLIGVVFDAVYLFKNVQTEDGFDITAIKTMNVTLFAGVLIVAIVIFAVAFAFARFKKEK